MASLPPVDPTSPSEIAAATFPTARKGYDPYEVRQLLRRVAEQLSTLQDERDRLAVALAAAEQAAAAERAPLDEATVAARLGEEAASVLRTAHDAASQIRAKAEESLARTLREAEDHAARLRADADLEAAHVRQDARDEAASIVAAAQQEGREMVAEARAVRERMLSDMARRRDAAREQISRLHADRDHLVDAFRTARSAVDEVLADLGELAPELDVPVPTGEVPVLGEVEVSAFVAAAQRVEADLEEARERHPASSPSDALVSEEELEDELEAVVEELEEELDEQLEGVEAPDQTAQADGHRADDEQDEGAAAGDEPDAAGAREGRVVVEEVPVVEDDRSGGAGQAGEPEAPSDEWGAAPGAPGDHDEGDEGDEASAGDGGGLPAGAVDALFARLKAASASSVARDVLDADTAEQPVVTPEGPGAPEAGAPADAEASSAPVADVSGTEPDVAALVARRSEALAPVRTVLARALKRVLADEQNDVLDHLRRAKAVPTLDELAGAEVEHAGRYGEAAREHLRLAAIAGVQSLGPGEPDAAAAVLDDTNALDRSVAEVGAELVVPLRERLAALLASAADPADAAAQARMAYREWKTERLDQVADELAHAAYGRGAFVALAPGTPVCWALDPNGPGCADAEDNVLAGDIPAGEAFPTGHRHAPAYPGCRCLVVPSGS